MGITVPRLTYLTRIGTFPIPTGDAWGMKKTWTESDVSACKQILATVTDRRRRRCPASPAHAA
jgi:hypothetical protein